MAFRAACAGLIIRSGLIGLVMAGLMTPAGAQSPVLRPALPAALTASPSPGVQPQEDGAALSRALEAAQAAFHQASAAADRPAGASREEVLERNHLMGELVTSLQHTIEATERLPDLRQRVAAQEARARDWSGFPTPPPYSVLLVDQLRAAQEAATLKVQGAEARAVLLKEEEAEAEEQYRAAEVARRQSEERGTEADTEEQRIRQRWLGELAGLRLRAAAAGLEEARILRAVTAAEADEQRALIALLDRQVATARKATHFPRADLERVLAGLDHRRAGLEQQADAARAASLRSRQALALARQALAQGKNLSPPEGSGSADGTVPRDVLEQMEELRRSQADTDDLSAEVTHRMLDVLAWERTGWEMRWLLLNSGDHEKLRGAMSEMEQLFHRLQTWNLYLETEIERALSRNGNRYAAGRVAGQDEGLLAQMQALQQQQVETLRNAQQAITTLLRTLSLWRQDLQDRGGDRAPAVIARDLAGDVWQILQEVWRFEIFTAEDTLTVDGRTVVATRSVTVGKTGGAILFLAVGYGLSAWLSRRLGRFAVDRLNAAGGHASMIARWLHFMLLGLLFIIALYMVNIPLTVFAFLGGALAIGLGFGTQVLLKNLVSGLMLLIERPLRVGDRIEVGSVSGWVTDIGVRSSTIRTNDGIEILVPNSTFIENNVTNWTYSSSAVRRTIRVGVDYSAAPEQVRDLLLQICARHDLVLRTPAPRVLFEDFGADALIFTLQYWIDYSQISDGAQTASDLRFIIRQEFEAAGIGIPYPQRVVHFAPAPGGVPTAAEAGIRSP